MTTETDIVNRALQIIGTRTTVTTQELATNSSNEAIQANLSFTSSRDTLLRMAPWNCAYNTVQLVYITSSPGTPQNTSPVTQTWQRGQPVPPFLYEYQYPVDCLRACQLLNTFPVGWGPTTPIYPTTVGNNPIAGWVGPPVIFKVAIDQFFSVSSATVANGGAGYAVGDVLTMPIGPIDQPPIGAPAKFTVLTAPGGVIGTVTPINHILGSATPLSGSYYRKATNPVLIASSSGSGVGGSLNMFYTIEGSQRVILCNQQSACLSYVKQVVDPNVMDAEFKEAWAHVLGAKLAIALTGDKGLANNALEVANTKINQARVGDGNEGLTINDVTPDWIRIRGVNYDNQLADWGFNWGGLWPLY